jgi:hypothetical protein
MQTKDLWHDWVWPQEGTLGWVAGWAALPPVYPAKEAERSRFCGKSRGNPRVMDADGRQTWGKKRVWPIR